MQHPDFKSGDLAQLVEHLLCKQGVNGSNPLSSTIFEFPEMKRKFSVAERQRIGGFAAVL